MLSDLHANWHALQAVLADAEGKYDQIVCCGDIVGYNPQPAQVLEWVRANCVAVIRGNHDKVVAGLENWEWFNDVAQAAARWSIGELSEGQLLYLRQLPQGPIPVDGFQIWHGSPADEDEYITAPLEAAPRFGQIAGTLGFFGHTHVQGGFFSKYGRIGVIPQVRASESDAFLPLEADVVYMINPGSVGQPRDRDPRAAYALYDTEQRLVTFRRVAYPALKTAEEIREAGLPDMLGLRLLAGF